MSRAVAGRWEVLAPVGSGGVSEVNRARDRRTGAEVALKELLPQFTADRLLCRRFLREAEVARRLDHPGVVRVLDAGEDAGRPFLVMELVQGEDLRRRLDRDGALGWPEARRVALAVARALEHAHARGVVHRDLKPHNVLVEREGGAVKLTDFGLARVQTLASLTGSSLVWGSPEYMAPELFGRGRADPRSDLYSLGVLLFELTTGRLPWKDRSLGRLAASVGDAAGALPSLGQGESLDRLLASLLAPAPADRPSDVAEVIAVLEGRATPPLPVPLIPCGGCGELRPDDVPHCFSCGHRDLTAPETYAGGRWSVVLKSMKDDVASMEALHQAMGNFTGRRDLRLKFLIGHRGLYSKKEQEEAIKLPAVLFSHLDEARAREIARVLEERGFKVAATHRRVLDLWRHPPARAAVGGSVMFTAVTGVLAFATQGLFSPFFLTGLGVTAGTLVYWGVKLSGLRGLFLLRAAGAPAPGADRLLGSAREVSGGLRAPEVRALFVEVSRELFRLARRAEQLARRPGSTEEALARRLLEAAPAVSARLEAIARRLELLDQALERDSDGDTMRALATLTRRMAARPAEIDELETARRELEATMERRQLAEAERERLAVTLCRALGTVRDSYRRARTMVTLDEREAAAVTAALEGLEAELGGSTADDAAAAIAPISSRRPA